MDIKYRYPHFRFLFLFTWTFESETTDLAISLPIFVASFSPSVAVPCSHNLALHSRVFQIFDWQNLLSGLVPPRAADCSAYTSATWIDFLHLLELLQFLPRPLFPGLSKLVQVNRQDAHRLPPIITNQRLEQDCEQAFVIPKRS